MKKIKKIWIVHIFLCWGLPVNNDKHVQYKSYCLFLPQMKSCVVYSSFSVFLKLSSAHRENKVEDLSWKRTAKELQPWLLQ